MFLPLTPTRATRRQVTVTVTSRRGAGKVGGAGDGPGAGPAVARRPLPARLLAGLTLATLLDTALQVAWKFASLELPADDPLGPTVRAVLHDRWFLPVLLLMSLQFGNWMMVLGAADLSYAEPVSSLSYAFVPVLSWCCFGETLSLPQTLGVVLVLAGVWLVGQTDHLTSRWPAGGGAA